MALIVTQDGSHTIFSEKYGVPYHSRYGAISESAHVYKALNPEGVFVTNYAKGDFYSCSKKWVLKWKAGKGRRGSGK